VIAVERATKRFAAATAVRDVSFDVAAGELFGLIGADGAGKTTTVRLAAGLLGPDEGRVRVFGRDPARDRRDVTSRVGYFSQRFTLYGDLSVDENIAFFAEIHGVVDYPGRRDRLLELTGLTPFRRRQADQLSGGMKQKLALACTLVHEPDLILLDEPTTGVDPVSRREFWKLLSTFRSRGITILVTTPYLDEAERCSRVGLLHDGRLLALDTPARLRERQTAPVVEVLAEPQRLALESLEAVPWIARIDRFGERAHVRLASGAPADPLPAMAAAIERAGARTLGLRPIPTTLEDVFIDRLAPEDAGSVSRV
jgi:ABC-2 type transport system ATP-binding protein